MKNLSILLLFICFSLMFGINADAKSFSDIPKDYPYYKEINYLTDLGIINGHIDGSFKPKQLITNRQAAVMLIRALNASEYEYNDPNYIDVSKTDPAYKEIAIARRLNLFYTKVLTRVTLTSNEAPVTGLAFKPDDYLERDEMAHALVYGFYLAGREDIKFSDVSSKNTLAVEEIPILADNNITTGYEDGTFKPKGHVSREHFALFLYRTLQVVNSPKENLLTILQVGESIAPLPEYILAGSNKDENEKGSVYSIHYDGGRYALTVNKDEIRLLDMYSMKSTKDFSYGHAGDIKGNIAAWVNTEGMILFDLTTKLTQFVELPNPAVIQSIYFSDDGNFIFLKTWPEVELTPQYVYNVKTGEFSEIPYYDLSDMQNSWLNGEFYFWGMSDFEREAIGNGYSYSKIVQGLYAYNPVSQKTRTIFEEESFVSPGNLNFDGNYGAFSDSGVHLINLQSGEIETILNKSVTNGSYQPYAYVSAISEDAVYFVDGQSVKQYDLSSKITKTILTLASVSKDSNHNDITLKIIDNYLFIYGSNVPMTILRIK